MNRDLAEWVNKVDGIDELREVAEQLAPDARSSLIRIARRLLAGQKKYGALHLDRDPRVWRDEIREELLDAVVYFEFRDLKEAQRGQV